MARCRKLLRTSGLLLTAIAAPASAWQIDYSLQAGLGYSDNIDRSSTDPTGQAILIPRLDFDVAEEGSDLRVRAAGQIEYRDYLQGAFDNEFRGQLAGIGSWIILPYRLSFDVEDYAAVEPVNVLAPNTPNNEQETNVLSLGPTLRFRLQPTLNGEAELRASRSNASRSNEFDANRVSAALRAVKDLNPTDKLSGNVEGRHVHFTNPFGGPDYDRYDAYARYQSRLADIDIDVAAGASRLTYADAPDRSGPLARGRVTWHATPENSLALGFLRQYSDASQDLIVDPATITSQHLGGPLAAGSTPITSQVFLERRVDLGWQFKSVRWGAYADPYVRNYDYVIDPTFNQNAHGIGAGVSYRPRELWTLAFDAAEETRDYTAISRRDEDVHLDLSFTDRLARHWSVRADLIRNERNSSLADQAYRENVVFLSLIFTR